MRQVSRHANANVVWIMEGKIYRDSNGDLHETVEAAKERLDVYGTFIERGLRNGTLRWRRNPKNGVIQVYGDIPNYAKGREKASYDRPSPDKTHIVKWILFWLFMILCVAFGADGHVGPALMFIFAACGVLFVGSLIDGSMARSEEEARKITDSEPVYGLDYGIGDSVWAGPSFSEFRDELRDMINNRS